ncbi:MAG: class C sortase [Lachnospiraceae bacterium]|jgi:sortase A|nr:class C sortase [Lachnospiraceae bacterium]
MKKNTKKKKRKVINILIIIFLVAGLLVLLFPFAQFAISDFRATRAVVEYNDDYKKMEDKQIKNEWAEAKAYNKALNRGNFSNAFTSGNADLKDNYENVLNVDQDGMMGYIQIPKINVDLPIFHDTNASSLDKGVGHVRGTYLPIGGKGTHSVLSAHTGLKSSVLFTNLKDLTLGDEFYITVLDKKMAYKVDKITVVLPEDISQIQSVDGKDYVTLVTCTPYGINSHRLLVRGIRVPYTEKEIANKIKNTKHEITWMTKVFIGIMAFIVIIILYAIYRHIKKKKHIVDNRRKDLGI